MSSLSEKPKEALWNENALKDFPDDGNRYLLVKGRLNVKDGKPIYQMEKALSTCNQFDVARKRANKFFRRGINVVIIDRRSSAIVGNLWMLSKELIQ